MNTCVVVPADLPVFAAIRGIDTAFEVAAVVHGRIATDVGGASAPSACEFESETDASLEGVTPTPHEQPEQARAQMTPMVPFMASTELC